MPGTDRTEEGAGREGEAADADFLAQIPIFGGLPDLVLRRVVDLAREIRVPAAGLVFAEGEPARSMFIVRDGELEICKRARNGAEFCLAVLQRGDCVGEMSLIDIQPRSATARAIGGATLCVIDQQQIANLYQTDLEVYTLLVLNIAREISRRLRRADQVLVDAGLAVQGVWPDT
ncbi:MAG TPA: cyclic nucleotide-binding domain-containing protein [Polyangia bacterium]|jgi:CRP-like cAMP-binding protein|nr:cyclic nucleotide-binding domain-containing protein [Polyangia bacterium]